MKKILLLLVSFVCTNAIAQPILTATNTNPVGGETYKFKDRNNEYIGNETATGINYTWDFSNLDTINIDNRDGNMTSTSVSNIFEFKLNNSFAGISEYGLGAYPNRLEITNAKTFVSPTISFQDNKLLDYPFTYGDSFTNNWTGTGTSGPSFTSHGSTVVRADGYGTLKLPSGTYNDVLRVKVYNARYDTLDVNNSIVGYQIDTIFRWYLPDVHWPVLETTTTTAIDITQSQVTYRKNTRFMENIPTSINGLLKNEEVIVYPNPTNKEFVLSIEDGHLNNYTYKIFDIYGRELNFSTKREGHYVLFKLANGQKGMYILSILDKNKIVGTRQILLR